MVKVFKKLFRNLFKGQKLVLDGYNYVAISKYDMIVYLRLLDEKYEYLEDIEKILTKICNYEIDNMLYFLYPDKNSQIKIPIKNEIKLHREFVYDNPFHITAEIHDHVVGVIEHIKKWTWVDEWIAE